MTLKKLRERLKKRIARRDRQGRLWRRTHKRGHAKAATKEAKAVRYLRSLIRKLKPSPGGPTQMYDSVDLDQIPPDAAAVAGYVGGSWPTYKKLAQRFPDAKRLSIAVASRLNADCLDIEAGDAEPADAPRWVKRQLKRGIKRPVVYASASVMPLVLNELSAHGIGREEVRVWTAHYGAAKHRCGPKTCGYLKSTTADATQFTDGALGRNLDESVLAEDFWG